MSKGVQAIRHNHTFLKLVIAILILGVGLLILKYIKVKQEWKGHVVKLSEGIQKYEFSDQIEDAEMIAAIITEIPSSGAPIFSQQAILQKTVSVLNAKTQRSIVVVDKNLHILADSVAANVGKEYKQDANGEIKSTLFDGVPRSFIEKSSDFPNGINQAVVQIKDSSGTIVGAVVISSSNIFK